MADFDHTPFRYDASVLDSICTCDLCSKVGSSRRRVGPWFRRYTIIRAPKRNRTYYSMRHDELLAHLGYLSGNNFCWNYSGVQLFGSSTKYVPALR